MKTLFRVLLILAAASIIGGLMYAGASASSSPAANPQVLKKGKKCPKLLKARSSARSGKNMKNARAALGFPAECSKRLYSCPLRAGFTQRSFGQAGRQSRHASRKNNYKKAHSIECAFLFLHFSFIPWVIQLPLLIPCLFHSLPKYVPYASPQWTWRWRDPDPSRLRCVCGLRPHGRSGQRDAGLLRM